MNGHVVTLLVPLWNLENVSRRVMKSLLPVQIGRQTKKVDDTCFEWSKVLCPSPHSGGTRPEGKQFKQTPLQQHKCAAYSRRRGPLPEPRTGLGPPGRAPSHLGPSAPLLLRPIHLQERRNSQSAGYSSMRTWRPCQNKTRHCLNHKNHAKTNRPHGISAVS